MHGDAGYLPVHQLTLARVQADTDFQSELGHFFSDGATAADGACRTVEGGQEAVPRRVHLLAHFGPFAAKIEGGVAKRVWAPVWPREEAEEQERPPRLRGF